MREAAKCGTEIAMILMRIDTWLAWSCGSPLLGFCSEGCRVKG